MLFAQFVNLNNSQQTNGHLLSRLLRKKFCTKLAGEVLAMLSMSLRPIPDIQKKKKCRQLRGTMLCCMEID